MRASCFVHCARFNMMLEYWKSICVDRSYKRRRFCSRQCLPRPFHPDCASPYGEPSSLPPGMPPKHWKPQIQGETFDHNQAEGTDQDYLRSQVSHGTCRLGKGDGEVDRGHAYASWFVVCFASALLAEARTHGRHSTRHSACTRHCGWS